MPLRRLLETLHSYRFHRAGLLALPLALLTTIALAPESDNTFGKASALATLTVESALAPSAWRDVGSLPSGIVPNAEDRANLPWFATYSSNLSRDSPLPVAEDEAAFTPAVGAIGEETLFLDRNRDLSEFLQAWAQPPSISYGSTNPVLGFVDAYTTAFAGGGAPSNFVAASGASSGKSTARHPGRGVPGIPADEHAAGETVPRENGLPAPANLEPEPDSHPSGKPPGDTESPALPADIPWNQGADDSGTEIHAVPEPGTLGLWMFGLAACFLFRRRVRSGTG